MPMNIRIATEADKPEIFALRADVFVKEQNVPPELEFDSEDQHATHIIARENGRAVGCARVLLDGDGVHIGRLVVKKEVRGKGIGSAICRFILDDYRKRGYRRFWLNAQLQAVGFYETLGFCPRGGNFMDAGIPHVQMVLDQTA